MKIVIIGFATSYKSTIARHLSQKLNIPLFDVDKLAESQAGLTISQMFAQKGESYFRDIESQVLCQLSTQDNCVVSCGGGSVMSPQFSQLAQNATVVWLKVDGKNAHGRLNGHTRPLFDKLTVDQLTQKIAERTPYYAKFATLEVNTNGKGSKQVFAEVCKSLNLNWPILLS